MFRGGVGSWEDSGDHQSRSRSGSSSSSSAGGHGTVTKPSVVIVSENSEFPTFVGLSGCSEVVPSIEHVPRGSSVKCVIFDTDYARDADISWMRRLHPTAFIAIFSQAASENPIFRFACFQAGANMVAHEFLSLHNTITECVLPAGTSGGYYECPYCQMRGLSEDELWRHCPTFHINWPNNVPLELKDCPICRRGIGDTPLQVHIHEEHGPSSRSSRNSRNSSSSSPSSSHHHVHHSGRLHTQLYNFSLVVCRHPVSGKFLLCQEFANQGFWLPGGAVDGGETFQDAARRETMEEAGMPIDLKGILGIEYNPCGRIGRDGNHYMVRMRVIFYAEPSADGLRMFPKSSPDFESAGACWCSYDEMKEDMKLRGSEPKQWARYLSTDGVIYPLDLLKERIG